MFVKQCEMLIEYSIFYVSVKAEQRFRPLGDRSKDGQSSPGARSDRTLDPATNGYGFQSVGWRKIMLWTIPIMQKFVSKALPP